MEIQSIHHQVIVDKESIHTRTCSQCFILFIIPELKLKRVLSYTVSFSFQYQRTDGNRQIFIGILIVFETLSHSGDIANRKFCSSGIEENGLAQFRSTAGNYRLLVEIS